MGKQTSRQIKCSQIKIGSACRYNTDHYLHHFQKCFVFWIHIISAVIKYMT